MKRKLLFVVNVDWFFMSHRLPIALAALRQGYEVHLATAITDQLASLQQQGLVVHPILHDRSGANPIRAARVFFQIFLVFLKVRPDMVHLVTIKPVLLGGIAARLAGVPAVVAAISGLGYVFTQRSWASRLRRWLVAALYRLALRHKNIKVIFQNQHDRATLNELADLKSDQVEMIRGSGVELDVFQVRPVPAGVPVVVLAARLLGDKGVREFVQAARRLQQKGISVRCCLVGAIDPGNPSSLTEKELAAWRSEGIVELWGQRDDMPQVLSQASIVVLPSYREGLPKVLLEAAACGRSVITTDVPGCRDAIEPGITGLLVPVRDAVALADAIESLINDPARRLAMGAAARKLAVQAFDIQQVVARHLQIYQHLINKSVKPTDKPDSVR